MKGFIRRTDRYWTTIFLERVLYYWPGTGQWQWGKISRAGTVDQFIEWMAYQQQKQQREHAQIPSDPRLEAEGFHRNTPWQFSKRLKGFILLYWPSTGRWYWRTKPPVGRHGTADEFFRWLEEIERSDPLS